MEQLYLRPEDLQADIINCTSQQCNTCMNMKPDDLLFPSSFSGTEHCWVLHAVKVQVKHMQITFSVTIRTEDTHADR